MDLNIEVLKNKFHQDYIVELIISDEMFKGYYDTFFYGIEAEELTDEEISLNEEGTIELLGAILGHPGEFSKKSVKEFMNVFNKLFLEYCKNMPKKTKYYNNEWWLGELSTTKRCIAVHYNDEWYLDTSFKKPIKFKPINKVVVE
jgi:hypothetical protein